MELHAAWNHQTQSGRLNASQRARLMPLWRLRAQMAFLIDNLQYYLQVDVLDSLWLQLSTTAEQTADFEQLRAAHENTLAALEAQCFLQAGSVSAALSTIFQLCLALTRILSFANAGTRRDFEGQFRAIEKEFGRQAGFLLAFLSSIASPQASPHLAQLLLRLNFNNFFIGQTHDR